MNRNPSSAATGLRSTGRRDVHDVAIVGAGMVGAACALRLARAGFDVAIIESRAAVAWHAEDDIDLRVVALASSSRDLLDSVDAWSTIAAARVCPYRRMHVWDALAPGELNFDSADEGAAELGHIVENRLIQHVLWQALLADARITVLCPAQVEATQVDGDRRTLRLDDGSRAAARLVVAADGADSALRSLLGIAACERDYGQRAIVAHVVSERAHEFTAWQRFVPGGTVAFLPLLDSRPLSANHGERGMQASAQRSSVVWSVPQADAARLLALDDAAFCAQLGAAFDFRLGQIHSTTQRAAFPLRMKLAEHNLAERFALIGDAAHVVHPLAGQGVNLGLRDAAELAATMIAARAAGRDFAAPETLRRFARRRHSDNVLSARAFDAIQRLFASEAMPLAALRGAALGVVDAIAPLKRVFARHAAGR